MTEEEMKAIAEEMGFEKHEGEGECYLCGTTEGQLYGFIQSEEDDDDFLCEACLIREHEQEIADNKAIDLLMLQGHCMMCATLMVCFGSGCVCHISKEEE